jgi:hypothetical protein
MKTLISRESVPMAPGDVEYGLEGYYAMHA